ncbi:MAG: hypothetical protein JJ901_04415 [Erythrobacter sp.]|uniref:hypothetical protein n=1 Tax=Erythrobacter sp. TaxID=1042 RepID=UPI001B220517|nr:hypothetical protein [Erythrobacter sp.]MBO6767536.1 hypothetical protein [Erythrobacter sp.]
MNHFPPTEIRNLNELEAFDAMIAFIRAYWELRGKSSDDIANLLSNIDRNVWANGVPGDPASWGDWQIAVSSVLRTNGS